MVVWSLCLGGVGAGIFCWGHSCVLEGEFVIAMECAGGVVCVLWRECVFGGSLCFGLESVLGGHVCWGGKLN